MRASDLFYGLTLGLTPATRRKLSSQGSNLVSTPILMEFFRAQEFAQFSDCHMAVRVYLNPNIGRFWTMDDYDGGQEDPQSLHKYAYCQGNPVNGKDPSGMAVYFVERHFSGYVKSGAFVLNSGHGYLLFTASSDDGVNDPFEAHQQIINTFSFHPYSWNAKVNAPFGVPARVWEKDTADTSPGFASLCFLVTTSASDQSKLYNYIIGWIHQAGVGRDFGPRTADLNDPGNEIGNPHEPAPMEGGVYYSLYGQNCVWWSAIMLKQSGINVPTGIWDDIKSFNEGIGYASQVVLGTRSASTQGRVQPIPVYSPVPYNFAPELGSALSAY